MLRLRKVELFGFKSFADRTTVVFPGTGIAAVVGPNGCGKSNIADAILWVLGEQSAKTLRSGKMADCIFSGTDDRPPTNLAEVSLTLVDPDAEAAGEIVTNPLFRTDDPEPEEQKDHVEVMPDANAEEVADTEAPESAEPEADDASQANVDAKPKRNRLGMKLEAGDIVVTRRLYRDGKSEYYLNGSFCRLRDIQNIFMGTGLGPESYAIIEQGRIGQILSSRPSDRRALLEEAAGVTKYKTQKRLAEGKLAAAKQNLLRVNDIFEEVTKQLASLKRQASRARRYRELKDESVVLRRVLLATQLEGLTNIESTLDARASEKASRVSTLLSELTALEEGQTESQSRQFELESRVRQEQNRVGELMVAMERAQAGLTDNLRQQEETRQKLEQLKLDRATHSDTEERLEGEIATGRAHLAESRSAVEEITVQTGIIGAEASQIGARIEELATALANAQQSRTRTVEDLAVKRAELGQTDKSLQELEQRSDRLRESAHLAETQIRQTAAEATTVRARYETARGDVIQSKDLVALAEQDLEACLAESSREKKALEGAREALTTATAREEALNDLIARRTAFAEPVRKLLLHGGGRDDELGAARSRTESEMHDYESASRFGGGSEPDTTGDGGGNGGNTNSFKAVGVVADFAEFDNRYADLIQTFLKEELEYVVVDTYDTARDGVSLLRDNAAGHATFLVDSFGRAPVQMPSSNLAEPRGAGLIGPIGTFLNINGPLGNEAKKVLPRLNDTYLVESTSAAETLAADYPRHRFLAPDGTCYQGRLVSGGTPKAHGAYKLEQDAQEATDRRADIEPKAMALAVSADELDARRGQTETQLSGVQLMLGEQEKQLSALEQELLAVESRRTRLQDSLAEINSAQESCRQQRETLLATQAQSAESIQLLESSLSTVAAEIAGLTEQHSAACNNRDSVQPRLAELQSRRAALEERLAAREAAVARLAEDTHRETDARRTLDALEESLTALRTNLAEQESELRQRVETSRTERKRQEELCAELDTGRDQLRVQVTEKEAVVRQQRRELDSAREEKSGIDIERARVQSDRQHLETAVQSEFGLTGESLRDQVEERLEGEALQEAELRDGELRRKLDNIGPVNMMALEEFQECEQRHNFLTEQREDLMASMEDIRRTIAELDEIAHRKFAEAFETINNNYEETFKTLFGGGSATLRLTEADDPSEAGVELICQPPGKRLQNVMLLSGGEKALAALSLLIAIFRYAPSPFCILDEVDAPLDDTNIGRFTRLIEQMAPQTQFILVTHSKKTMEAAALLYGVTMQNAVSQVVSVRFDDAATHAAA